MNFIIYIILLISIIGGGFSTISRVNDYAQRAAKAYQQEEYIEAIAAYEHLVHDLEVRDDQIQLNLAHSYYKAGLWPRAQEAYQLLVEHPSSHLRAVVHLQLGNLATKHKKYRQALTLYKTAIVAEPKNDAARYNYELLKKYIDLHPETPKDTPTEKQTTPEEESTEPDSLTYPPPAADELEPQPKKQPDANGNLEEEVEKPEPDKNGQHQQNAGAGMQDTPEGRKEREQQSGGAPGDTEGMNPEGQADAAQQSRNTAEGVSEADVRAQTRRMRLQQMDMSPEKARLLLDAMRNAEIQYIQQLPKKSTKKPDRSKPNW